MLGFLQMAKDELTSRANPAGVYVDFTMGRGRDTLFLCQLAPKGKVYAFDVQQEALDSTAALLAENKITNATLILDSHERFARHLPGKIDGGLFNLGFFPGGDRRLTTRVDTTLLAVSAALAALKPQGTLAIVVYPGHPEGAREGQALQSLLAGLDQTQYESFLYRLLNVSVSPYLLLIEKRA